jgi:tripartite-type tricarboxylate transporter receptor subunit TctC
MNVITGTWRGLAVPKNTPADIVKILEDAAGKVANSQEFKDFMGQRNFGIRYLNSTDFQNFMNDDSVNLKAIVEEIKKQNAAASVKP